MFGSTHKRFTSHLTKLTLLWYAETFRLIHNVLNANGQVCEKHCCKSFSSINVMMLPQGDLGPVSVSEKDAVL